MKTFLALLMMMLLMTAPAVAQQASSINPNEPPPNAPIDSATIRTLALAAYTDITALMNDHNLPAIGANQVLGSLAAGVPSGISIPGCDNPNSALNFTQGVGFSCHTIGGSGLGTVISVSFAGDGVIFSTTPSTPVTSFGNVTPIPLSYGGNSFLASPANGSVGATSFRAIVLADVPVLPPSKISGLAASATTDTTNAANISSGTIPLARLTANVFTSSSAGIVPPSGGGSTNVLRADGSWGPGGGSTALNANQILGALTTGTGVGLNVPDCSTALSALSWTPGVGLGCNLISAGTGTVNSGVIGQVGIYGATGNVISGASLGDNLAIVANSMNYTQPADRVVSAGPDTITSTDCGGTVVYNSGSSVAVSLAAASTSGLTQGCGFILNNKAAGFVTVTPTTSTIGGKSSLIIPPGTGCAVRSDSTNYQLDLSSCSALTLPMGTATTTPADNATCTVGQTWFDSGFFYVCVVSGTVKRATLATY